MSSTHRRHGVLSLQPLSLAVHGALLGLLCLSLPAAAQTSEPAAAAARKGYAIPAGSLEASLSAFAAAAGAPLSFDPALVAGKQSRALQGNFSVQEGFNRLLEGSGLELLPRRGGGYTLRPQTSATLPEVRVTAQGEAETAWGPVDGYVATRSSAGKQDLPLIEMPRSISVITEDNMRDRKVLSIDDAVAYTAGVQIGMAGNDPRFDEIKVRGFDVTTDADYRDGLRQPNTGWLSYFHTEPYALERLEVIKGPDSVLYGQISPGGLVNRVSKRPRRDAINEVEMQVGSDDHRQALFDLGGGGAEGSDWYYRIVGLTRKANTGTIGVNDDSNYIAPSLTWAPSAQTQVTFLSQWHDYRTSASPKPFQYSMGTLSRFWAGDIDYDGLTQKQWTVGYEAKHQINDTLRVRQNLRYAKVSTDNQYLEGTLAADGVTINRDAIGLYETMKTFSVDTAIEADIVTGSARHKLVTGVDYYSINGDIDYMSGTAPSIRIDDPDYHQYVPRPGTTLVAQGVKGSQTGVYINDQIAIDKWRVNLGARRDTARQTQSDPVASTSESQVDHATTGSAGLLYLFDNGVAPYISVANSFLPQFGSNVTGDNFKPTKGKQVEVGLKYQPIGSRSMHTISLFDLVQENVKTRDPANPANSLQTGELRSRGLELESAMKFSNGLGLTASYTYTDVEVTKSNDGNEGKRPYTSPKHMAAVWAKNRFASGIDAGLGVRWVGESYADTMNTEKNSAYTLVDARFGFDLQRFLPGASLALNANNLTDKQYVLCQDGYCYRGRGRTVILSFNYRF